MRVDQLARASEDDQRDDDADRESELGGRVDDEADTYGGGAAEEE